jgi:hypothetical protein
LKLAQISQEKAALRITKTGYRMTLDFGVKPEKKPYGNRRQLILLSISTRSIETSVRLLSI